MSLTPFSPFSFGDFIQNPTWQATFKALPLLSPETPFYLSHVDKSGMGFYVTLLLETLKKKAPTHQDTLPSSSSRYWILSPSLKEQERLFLQLSAFNSLRETPASLYFLPEIESSLSPESFCSPELLAERHTLLKQIAEEERLHPQKEQIICLGASSLSQLAPSATSFTQKKAPLKVGGHFALEKESSHWLELGYEKVTQVIERGQWAQRGSILDIFPAHARHPLRIELFDEEIESLREFDIDSQLTLKKLKEVHLFLEQSPEQEPLHHWISPQDIVLGASVFSPKATILLTQASLKEFLWQEPLEELLEEEMSSLSPQKGKNSRLTPRKKALQTTESAPEDLSLALYANPLGNFDAGDFVLQEIKRQQVRTQLEDWHQKGWQLYLCSSHATEEERFLNLLEEQNPLFDSLKKSLTRLDLTLNEGFYIPHLKIAFLSLNELLGRRPLPLIHAHEQREDKARQERAQAEIKEIHPGDLVVHLRYGIARFKEITPEKNDQEEEIILEFKDDVLLKLPLSQAHLISRYVGMGKSHPELSKLGDTRWKKACAQAQSAVEDFAARLLQTQSKRQQDQGFAHPPDSRWMQEFDATFPYKETPDQKRAIAQTKADMESPRPMDRLICGDVGFGKTEVALRAAFKCVTGGKQALLLAPTTVLAEQHWRSFKERMSPYPIRIELLSRFRSPAQIKATLAGLADGSVDMVIGTHRLISPDVVLKNPGLVIIDEEQRFGVSHKEKFKERFVHLDILTLSATPIPRTLYMALMGARDMSTIDTPPPNRKPVSTTICPYDERLIKRAIEKELSRGGQVYFLHNRVKTIDYMQKRIKELVPEARVVVGHGQMDKQELEEVMHSFVSGKADILLATTIIESGIDIPNANTILIDRADRFGLADLYQLRGRVGRSGHQAYAYLLLPRKELSTGDARKRIQAIAQYSELGSGFKIAMRDLEIRGAGNLLGTQQSGHIAAIGFDLYCQLLKQSLEALQGKRVTPRIECTFRADFILWGQTRALEEGTTKTHIPAYLPTDYIPDATQRIEAFKSLSQCFTEGELQRLLSQWKDRYGALPLPAQNLILTHELKILGAQKRLSSIEIKGQRLILTRNGQSILLEHKSYPKLRTTDARKKLPEALDWLKKL